MHFEIVPLEEVMKRVSDAALDGKDNIPLEHLIGASKSRKHQPPNGSPESGDRRDKKRR
jgi:hypothetical protein